MFLFVLIDFIPSIMTDMTKTNGDDMTCSNAAGMSCTLLLLTQVGASENEVTKHVAEDILNNLGNICKGKKGPLIAEVENDNFKDLLKFFSLLGKCAKKDILLLRKKNRKAIAFPTLKKDNSEQEFENAIKSCEEKIKDIEDKINELNQQTQILTSMTASCSKQNEGDLQSGQNNQTMNSENNIWFNQLKSLEEDIYKLGGYLQDMMTKWRRHEAILHIKYQKSKETICTKIKKHHQHLHVVFQKAFELTTKEVFCCLPSEHGKELCRDLELIIKKNAWCYDEQPPKCVVVKGNFTVAIRLFNVSKDEVDVDNILWQYIQEKSFENQNSREVLRVIGETSVVPTEFGVLISATVELEKYKRSTKRTPDDSFDHFNRILCKIKFKMPVSVTKEVECCSLPFTVRTGNPQLLPYTGAVDWCCWAKEDLYKAPYKCPTDLAMEKVLALLQVKYEAIDPDGFTSDHIKTLQNVILSFTKEGSYVKMHNFIQKRMPYQKRGDKSKQMVDLDISFYTWFVAACNTAEKFKKLIILKKDNEDKSRFIGTFLSFDAVLSELQGKPLGSAIFRISHNHVCNTKSSKPSARIIVDVVSGGNGDKDPVSHHIIVSEDEESLVREISSLTLPDRDPLVKTIIYPQNIPFDQIKKCYPDKETINENGYRTKSSEKKVIQIHNYELSTDSESTFETPPDSESTLNDDEDQPTPTKMPRSADSPYQSNDESNDLPQDLKSLKRKDLVATSLTPKEEDLLKSDLNPLTKVNEIYALLDQPFENDSEHMSS